MAAATSTPPATAPQPAQPPMLNHDLAIKSVEHAQTYYSILEAIPGHKVRLTRCDDDLHRDFLETFPELAAPAEGDKRPDPVSRITELSVKSPDAQPKWQALAAKYADKSTSPHPQSSNRPDLVLFPQSRAHATAPSSATTSPTNTPSPTPCSSGVSNSTATK